MTTDATPVGFTMWRYADGTVHASDVCGRTGAFLVGGEPVTDRLPARDAQAFLGMVRDELACPLCVGTLQAAVERGE